MLAHVSIGVRDLDRAKQFYEAALLPLGYRCIRAARSVSGWGFGGDDIGFWLIEAERPLPPDEKSALHFCFAASDKAARSMRSMPPRSMLAAKTTAHPVRVPNTGRIITRRSLSIPRAIASKPFMAANDRE